MPSLPAVTPGSTITVQQLVDYGRLFPWTTPALGIAGYSDEPAVSYASDIVQKIMAKSNPWKWNAAKFPVFQTQPYQQDYPSNVSQNTLGWLQSVIFIDINNTSNPIPVVPGSSVQSLLPTMLCSRPSKAAWIPNAIAQTASWPGPGTPYVDPLAANGGGPSNNKPTAITDSNGNIQLVTTYGVTGSTQPAWPALGVTPGTQTADGTVVWTLIDPNGVAIRLDAMATNNSVVWQVNCLYQNKPPVISSLGQTLAPIPDDLGYLIKQGFLCFCYKQGDQKLAAKFPGEYAQWLAAIQEALGSSDRELTEFGFYPSQPIQGGYGDAGGTGYSYPGWPGWQSG